MAKQDGIIVGLDVGTTKVCVIVGEESERGLNILGFGSQPSEGLRKGTVVNMDSTTRSISEVLSKAELMTDCTIQKVHLALSGSHVLGFNSHGIVAISDTEVHETDVERVIHAAKAVAVPRDRQIVEALQQDFIVDSNKGIKEPLGISGVRLEAKVHLVTAVRAALDNVERCCMRAGLEVESISLAQVASSQAVLHDDERELGVALVDIGGGTTDVAVWHDRSVVHSAVIPVAGNHLTQDIAVGMRTPLAEAEKLKLKHGCAMNSLIGADEVIDVPSVGGRAPEQRSRQLLGAIIEPRMEEILTLVQHELQRSGFEESLTSGVVITGGGSELEGLCELAEEVLGLPVRLAKPSASKIGGLVGDVSGPRFATAVGLVLNAHARRGELGKPSPRSSGGGKRIAKPGNSFLSRVKKWFSAAYQ